jgi:hypothetical protein
MVVLHASPSSQSVSDVHSHVHPPDPSHFRPPAHALPDGLFADMQVPLRQEAVVQSLVGEHASRSARPLSLHTTAVFPSQAIVFGMHAKHVLPATSHSPRPHGRVLATAVPSALHVWSVPSLVHVVALGSQTSETQRLSTHASPVSQSSCARQPTHVPLPSQTPVEH